MSMKFWLMELVEVEEIIIFIIITPQIFRGWKFTVFTHPAFLFNFYRRIAVL